MMNQSYKIIENYRNDVNLINKYHKFISKIFPSISFEEWYEKGFWTNKYVPFSLIKNDEIISNVSVAIMNVFVNGQKRVAAQIGAVGTLPEIRHRGLSRYLMNYVIEKLKNEVDFFFLFANETVMDFYPKFGFRSINENIFTTEINISKTHFSAKKLNLSNKTDYSLIQDLIENRKIITKYFGAEKYDYITMWHILNTYYNDLYYLEEEGIIFIKTEREGNLNIWEVIYDKEFNMQEALSKIINSDKIRRINYYFPPDQLEYEYDQVIVEQSGLFVRGETFKDNALIKFPETAHT